MAYNLMKYLLASMLVLSTFAGHGQQSPKNSPMAFEHTEWDFGRIRETDGKVSHIFEFTNKGKKPFVVQEVAVSCGCTTPTFSKAPVRPGAKASIEITYDPTDRPGNFTKDIYVIGSGGITGTVIKIKGDVIPRPRSVEEDYPVALSSGLRLSTRSVNMGYVTQGRTNAMMVGYANTSDKELTVRAESQPQGDYFRFTVPSSIAPGEKGEMTVMFDLRNDNLYGMLSVATHLIVNGKRDHIPVSATAIGIDNFRGKDNSQAPQCYLSSSNVNFGEISGKETLSSTVTIANKGKSPLIIRDVKSQSGASATLSTGSVIEAGNSIEIKVSVTTVDAAAGRLIRSIMITTNDPQRPFREIRLVATIK